LLCPFPTSSPLAARREHHRICELFITHSQNKIDGTADMAEPDTPRFVDGAGKENT
jgi:hypothetical protein